MGSIIGRRDYERFLVLSKRDREMLSEDEQAELIEAEYPKPTELAALELRARGIDANASTLDYLIKKDAIPAPSGGTGRNRRTAETPITSPHPPWDAFGRPFFSFADSRVAYPRPWREKSTSTA